MSKLIRCFAKLPKRKADIRDDQYLLLNGDFASGIDYNNRFWSFPEDDEGDDGDSVDSFSTTATCDDNPGPGRSVDTYFYQPMGRWIEGLVLRYRFSVDSIAPVQISNYIRLHFNDLFFHFGKKKYLILSSIIATIGWPGRIGSVSVVGMQSLVKQTQSLSINRSAAALVALIHVSQDTNIHQFFVTVSRTMPLVGHFETLVGSLDESNAHKRPLLFLARIANAHVIIGEHQEISKELAESLRQKFIQLLNSYCNDLAINDTLDILGDVCLVYAQAVSCVDYKYHGPNLHIFKTIHHIITFFIISIYNLHQQCKSSDPVIQRYMQIILLMLAQWLDATSFRYLWYTRALRRYPIMLPMIAAALRGLSLIKMASYRHGYFSPTGIYLPVEEEYLPRRIRTIFKSRGSITPLCIETITRASTQRYEALLQSFDRFRKEVKGSDFKFLEKTMQNHYETWTEDKVQRTFDRAKNVRVQQTEQTTEFRRSLLRHYDSKEDQGTCRTGWRRYKVNCCFRSDWGEYLSSCLDWDWDLGSSLKSLFKIRPDTAPSGNLESVDGDCIPHSHPLTIVRGVLEGETLTVSIESETPLKDVRIAFTDEMGKTQHVTFTPDPPSLNVQPLPVHLNEDGSERIRDHNQDEELKMEPFRRDVPWGSEEAVRQTLPFHLAPSEFSTKEVDTLSISSLD